MAPMASSPSGENNCRSPFLPHDLLLGLGVNRKATKAVFPRLLEHVEAEILLSRNG